MTTNTYKKISALGVALILLAVTNIQVQAQFVQGFQKISDTEGGFTGGLNEHFGGFVAVLGDVDGDGINDMAACESGRIWILFLNSDGTVKAHQDISGISETMNCAPGPWGGGSVAGVGDLDEDGVPDMALGSPGEDAGEIVDAGAIWILFLNSDGTVKSSQKLYGGLGMPASYGSFGTSVAHLGDLDGDGITDILVGAIDPTNAGNARVLFLNQDGTKKDEADFSFEDNPSGGETGAQQFGWALTGLGDLDGDGVLDVAVSRPDDNDGGPPDDYFNSRGAVEIVFLNSDGTVKGNQTISDVEGGFTGGIEDGDRFGTSLAGLGDLNGDGTVELAVGLGLNWSNEPGAFWILSLNSDGTVNAYQRIGDMTGGFTGELDEGDEFASSLAALEDLNDDGVMDLVVGAMGDDDGGADHGAVWILFLAAAQGPSFTLIDAETDQPVAGYDPIPDGSALNLKRLPRYLNIRANVADSFESVRFAFDGNDNFRFENVAPYALFGDLEGDYANGRFRIGMHTLEATPYSEDNAGGEPGTSAEISFTVVREDPGMEVTNLVLVDSDTDEDLFTLAEGMALYLADLPTNLNVRADIIGPVESVKFELEPDNYSRTEEVAPYALFGDVNGDYAAGGFSVGSHVLKATPFRHPGATGQAGISLALNLIVEAGSAPSLAPPMPRIDELMGAYIPAETVLDAAYPNPFNPSTTIVFGQPETGFVKLVVYDVLGREVVRLVEGVVVAGWHEVVLHAGDLPSGTYLYRLETSTASLTRTILLLK